MQLYKTTMKRIVYISIAALALSIASCANDNADNAETQNDSIIDSLMTEGDSDALHEVTGVVIDGARRNIDLQVGDDTLNFELESSEDVSWEIGDTLTIRYYKRETGDSVVGIDL